MSSAGGGSAEKVLKKTFMVAHGHGSEYDYGLLKKEAWEARSVWGGGDRDRERRGGGKGGRERGRGRARVQPGVRTSQSQNWNVQDLAHTLRTRLDDHSRFTAPKRPPHSFAVEHYAGRVTYNALLLMDKNKDFTVAEHQQLMQNSDFWFMRCALVHT